MVLISFSCEEKKPLIINRECSQTIRPERKHPIEVGDILQIYWKVRKAIEKKQVHKIGEGITTQVDKLKFKPTRVIGSFSDSLSVLAEKDGFESKRDMWMWFEDKYGSELYDIDFRIIRWEWLDVE